VLNGPRCKMRRIDSRRSWASAANYRPDAAGKRGSAKSEQSLARAIRFEDLAARERQRTFIDPRARTITCEATWWPVRKSQVQQPLDR
jgi:hypothetical protein